MLNKLNPKGAIATIAIIATILPACTNQLEANRPASEPGNVTAEEVTDNTNELIGKTVTIRSEPVEKIGTNTFTISDEQFFGSEPIVVVNASGQPVVLHRLK
jgi:hypothetical protein